MHRSPKILHLSTYDQFGGAAKAAFRILESQSKSGINCSMFTLVKKTTSVLVKKIESSNLKVRIKLAHDQISNYRNQILEKSEELHSYGNISAGIIDQINNSDSDIINLHWIISMLSIEDIGKIKKPIVWTLHDMWPFCSHEHYLLSPEKMLKYSTTDPKKLQEYEHDINMETWLRKWKYWNKNNFILICNIHH